MKARILHTLVLALLCTVLGYAQPTTTPPATAPATTSVVIAPPKPVDHSYKPQFHGEAWRYGVARRKKGFIEKKRVPRRSLEVRSYTEFLIFSVQLRTSELLRGTPFSLSQVLKFPVSATHCNLGSIVSGLHMPNNACFDAK